MGFSFFSCSKIYYHIIIVNIIILLYFLNKISNVNKHTLLMLDHKLMNVTK